MYISKEQIEFALAKLDPIHPFFGTSFLAFKRAGLPIQSPIEINIAQAETEILEDFYNPLPRSKYYYIPLRQVGPKNRWVNKKKYPMSGLQKTRTTTFKDVFVHQRKELWAWQSDYIARLENFVIEKQKGVPVPAFHLAAWLFRGHDWPVDTQPSEIVDYFLQTFKINELEAKAIFSLDTSVVTDLLTPVPTLLDNKMLDWKSIRNIIGGPKDAGPDEGGILDFIELKGVGPAQELRIDFAERLNLITGDNGTGKTFLLECSWWALSGQWAEPEQPAYPRPDSPRPSITFQMSGAMKKAKPLYYDKKTQSWPLPDINRPVLPGLVLYARVNGSFMLWDPAKLFVLGNPGLANGAQPANTVRFFSESQVWDGLDGGTPSGKYSICNGLIRDWITWQFIEKDTFRTFAKVLEQLSHPKERLVPGEPVIMQRDDRRMPTLKLPYGNIPITHASAGMRRILSIAYLLVWAWEAHVRASQLLNKAPQSRLVILIDEIEAHLHPEWQRRIVPAIMNVVDTLNPHLQVQLIAATHSPLVTASLEPYFEHERDALFTINIVGQKLGIESFSFAKQGSADAWLTSDVFDLKKAYSVEAESALLDAKLLQVSATPNPEEIRKVNARLMRYMPEIDEFWPRWKFFTDKFK